jgi:predicted transposase YdaD
VKTDYDSPWKDILESYFQSALELCFPQIARQINWSKGVQLLSKEFQKIVRRSELGRRSVDVLAQVWSVAGQEQWVLLHVEVQAQRDPDFPRRMFDYYSRICQRYNRPVASLAILVDSHPDWKPSSHEQSLWGCKARFEFPVFKLLELANAEAHLLENPNPFAVVVLAQIKALQTSDAVRQRKIWKVTLSKLGHERGYSRRAILDLFAFIDWVMVLPDELELEFDSEIAAFEQDRSMKYITSIERKGRAEGLAEGRAEGLAEGQAKGLAEGQAKALRQATIEILDARFGEIPYELREQIQAKDSATELQRLLRLAALAADLQAFQSQLKSA